MAAERVRRRLAAILAMDMVGYSRQMAADEAGTLARLKAIRNDVVDPGIADHGGRIVKETGDGLLVEFSSAVGAVQCAVDIQRPLAERNAAEVEENRIAFRIGINLGDVIVEGDDIYGDGVNIAARLESIAEPGGIFVSRTVFDQVKKKVDAAFEDRGEHELKNIAEPIRVYAVASEQGEANVPTSEPGTIVLTRPAIAVLPLVNMSADPEQEYFADGLTEDLITALSHWRMFPVIARNSVFTYKGKLVKVQQVAEELGARYVLEGSVRKAGSRVRITTQLIDADSGHHIWADKYDREIEDIFAVQDEITRRIATTLQPELVRAEERRSVVKAPKDLTAWDYVQRGLSLLSAEVTAASAAEARQHYEKAIELDPGYSQAYTALAFTCHLEMVFGRRVGRAVLESEFLQAARRAVDLDQTDARAHMVLGMALMNVRQSELAVPELRRSIELNPSDPYAYLQLGSALDFVGESNDAIEVMKIGIDLNPQSPSRFGTAYRIALAWLHLRDFESSIEWARRSLTLNPTFRHPYVCLTASLAHAGRDEEAKQALARGEALHPGFIDDWHIWHLYVLGEQKQLVIEGLRKAGWTGQAPLSSGSRGP